MSNLSISYGSCIIVQGAPQYARRRRNTSPATHLPITTVLFAVKSGAAACSATISAVLVVAITSMLAKICCQVSEPEAEIAKATLQTYTCGRRSEVKACAYVREGERERREREKGRKKREGKCRCPYSPMSVILWQAGLIETHLNPISQKPTGAHTADQRKNRIPPSINRCRTWITGAKKIPQ